MGNNMSGEFEHSLSTDGQENHRLVQKRFIEEAYLAGKNLGYNLGYSQGFESGYDKGYAEGSNLGYNNGFIAGLKGEDETDAKLEARKNVLINLIKLLDSEQAAIVFIGPLAKDTKALLETLKFYSDSVSRSK